MEHITSDKWLALTKAFQQPDAFKSWRQVINSFVPFIVLWGLAYWAFTISVWLMIPIAFVAAMFGVRIFIIQHDCGHASFLKNRVWRDRIGWACSVITMTPYKAWQWEHAQHHAHSGNTDHRDLGEIKTLTATEFIALGKWEKIAYRIYRYPFFTFLVGPAWVFFGFYRWPYWKEYRGKKVVANSIWDTNVALLIILVSLVLFFGWEALIVQLTIVYFTAVLGVWLFYVQHQFEDGYWQPTENWNRVEAAVHGSSYFKLPKILQWFTGNIGFHHVHHLNPLVPNYELEACHNENEVLQTEVTTLTLANCWETMKLKFWDEKLQRMISMKEMKTLYLNR